MHKDIEALADELVAVRFEQEPLEAAMLGLDDGSTGLGDLSRVADDHFVDRYRSIAAATSGLTARLRGEGAELDEREILTLDVVGYSAACAADQMELRLIEVTVSDFFNSPVAGLVTILPQLALDTIARRSAYLRRLEALPRVLEQVGQRHLEGIASGRAPTHRGVTNALAFIDTVTSDPDVSGLRRRVEDDTDFSAAQDRILHDLVVPALLAYRNTLRHSLLERGRDDEHSGLGALPDGAELYRTMVRVSTSTRRTPEELHDTGLALIEALRNDFLTIGRRLWGMDDVAEIHNRLRKDPALRYDTSEEILEAARSTVRRAEAAAPHWLWLRARRRPTTTRVPSTDRDRARTLSTPPGPKRGYDTCPRPSPITRPCRVIIFN